MKDFLPASRYLVILAVAGCFVAAAALFGYGLIAVIRIVVQTIAADLAGVSRANRDVVSGAEHLAVDLIQMTDVFLLGTVIYLVGLGLHLLFINPRLPARPWTAVEDLEGLKEMLVRVIILLVGVTFLGAFVEHADNTPVRDLSISAAVVVFAFSLVVLVDKLPNWSRGKGAEATAAHTETLERE
ncbi:MAG: YqhA family protein [Thermomicrobiales bacterium]